jgi:hypothetical protein
MASYAKAQALAKGDQITVARNRRTADKLGWRRKRKAQAVARINNQMNTGHSDCLPRGSGSGSLSTQAIKSCGGWTLKKPQQVFAAGAKFGVKGGLIPLQKAACVNFVKI